MSKKQTILYIDSSGTDRTTVVIKVNGRQYKKTEAGLWHKSQIILPSIEKLTQDYNISLDDITAIEVNSGPGSFTGLRVGIAVAQALGFLFALPVNTKPVGVPIEPHYQITAKVTIHIGLH